MTPENFENQAYQAFQAALGEQDGIMKEIDNVFATIPNREEAERIVVEQYASKMNEAIKKTREAFDRWSDMMKES